MTRSKPSASSKRRSNHGKPARSSSCIIEARCESFRILNQMDRLNGKISIVTGAAQGIGRAIAEQFALQGAAVLVADVDEVNGEETAAIIRARGQAASFVRCDV